jgi:hypothetical protein
MMCGLHLVVLLGFVCSCAYSLFCRQVKGIGMGRVAPLSPKLSAPSHPPLSAVTMEGTAATRRVGSDASRDGATEVFPRTALVEVVAVLVVVVLLSQAPPLLLPPPTPCHFRVQVQAQ